MTATINASTSSGLIQTADTSGTLALQSNGTTKFTVSSTGAYGQVVSGTAVASTSGTSIDFTGIPSWVKRITVMFSGVSTNGSSNPLIQIGDAGGIEATGYISSSSSGTSGVGTTGHTTGFGLRQLASTDALYGSTVITLFGSNVWVNAGTFSQNGAGFLVTAGNKTLSDTLTQIRITTVNGTDAFDAGSINILYEG